jgi:hypothetical protein
MTDRFRLKTKLFINFKSMKKTICLIMAITVLIPLQIARAEEARPSLIHVYQTTMKNGKAETHSVDAGLVNMDDMMLESGSGCQHFVGVVKIDGLQFSQSGTTLQSFRFINSKGDQWSIPTNIEKLSNAERSRANNLIRVGKQYLIDVNVCGSGGFPSLVNLYDLSVQFRP